MNPKYLATAVIAAAAILALVVVWLSTPPSVRHADGVSESSLVPSGRATPAATISRDESGFFVQRFESTVRRLAASLSHEVPAPESLARGAREILVAYASEHVDAFETYCLSNEILPLAATSSDPRESEATWSGFAQWFQTSLIDHDAVQVRWRLRAGRGEAPVDWVILRTTTRDAARPFWLAQKDSDRMTVEVVMPLTSRDLDGRVFESSLGLEFGFDPASGSWRLVASRHYDVPHDVRLVEAPV